MASDIVLNMDGLLLNWLKNVGDQVKKGEIVAEVEADKATVEVEAPTDGVITELSAEIGAELSEGAVIGKIGAAGEAAAAPSGNGQAKAEGATPQGEAPKDELEPPAQKYLEVEDESAEQPVSGNGAVGSTTPEGRVKISPVARNMAEERGININNVRGTGPGGRIIKADIENFEPGAAQPQGKEAPMERTTTQPANQGQQAQAHVATEGIPMIRLRPVPQPTDDVEIIDTTRMRMRIASGTVESKQQIPHFYVTTDMDLQPLMDLRKQLNASIEDTGVKISVNDLIVKAVALTLRDFPNLNTHYYGDKLVRYKRVNVSSAVALPQGGVIYIVVKDADKASLTSIAQQNKDMAARAREGKVKPDDIQGSTFSVSNLGPWDVDHFIAIINPPEAGVLAIGAGKKVPVVQEDGTLGVGLRIKMTISVDHRVSDGAEGAAFLQQLRKLIEHPFRILA